ncbi:MAG TPA: ParA family protein, partial [Firmicutes bacterium]|nr:ParA family protein [Bacillota bacterium]
LGAISVYHGKRTCLIDYDPKANLTEALIETTASIPTVTDLLFYYTSFIEICLPVQDNFFLVPARQELTGFTRPQQEVLRQTYSLKEKISPYVKDFDLILIDTPPTLSSLTIDAISIADGILIPTQATYFCLKILPDFLNFCKRRLLDSKFIKAFVTMSYQHSSVSEEIQSIIREKFDTTLLSATIHHHIQLEESPASAQSIMTYDPNSIAAKEYEALYLELQNIR